MSLIYLVIAMSVVTYVPRMLPLVLLKDIEMPAYIKRFMEFIPYAALGAMIFPGILYSTGEGHIESALVGGVISVFLSLIKSNLVLVVIGGITGAFIMNVFLI